MVYWPISRWTAAASLDQGSGHLIVYMRQHLVCEIECWQKVFAIEAARHFSLLLLSLTAIVVDFDATSMVTVPLTFGESSVACDVMRRPSEGHTGGDTQLDKKGIQITCTHCTLQSTMERSYDTHIRTDLGEPSSLMSSKDYGIGNFTYDGKHLSNWVMPKAVRLQQLPTQVRERANDWSTSGAALDTALERMDELRADGMHRGWPNKKNTRPRIRYWPSSISRRAQCPTIGCQISKDPSLSDPLAKPDFTHPSFQKTPCFAMSHNVTIGMESPPFSPSDTISIASRKAEDVLGTLPKFATTDTERYPNTGGEATPPLSGVNTPVALASSTMSATFDENAWETYCNQWKAEHVDIRYNALSRFKGTARDMENLIREYCHFGEYTGALEVFNSWWCSQRAKVALYEGKVKSLEVPSEEGARCDRKSKGLTL
jgi:hypothetical protein